MRALVLGGGGVVGVAWRVQIMPVRNATTDFAVMAAALRYAVDNGAQISNHSYTVFETDSL